MAGVDVKIGADTGGFAAGLSRVRGELDKFKAKAGSSFSFGGLVKGAAAWLGAGAVLDGVLSVFKQLAENAQLIADRTERARAATVALTQVKTGPEGRLAAGQKEERFLAKASKEAQDAADKARNRWQTFIPGGIPFAGRVGDAARAEADGLQKIASEYTDQYQARVQQNAELQFQLENQTREINRQVDKEIDLKEVRAGRMSQERSSSREAIRAYEELIRVSKNPALGENARKEAGLKVYSAAAAYQDAQITQIQGFKADSLARIGGGGNVYTGTSSDPVVSELKQVTALLRQIADERSSRGLDGQPLKPTFVFKR